MDISQGVAQSKRKKKNNMERTPDEPEWAQLMILIDKLSMLEGRIEGGWDELIDLMVDSVEEESNNEDKASAFFNLYQFLCRLYYRVKRNPEKRPFNVVLEIEIDGEKYFRIENYDYKTFKWAKEHNAEDRISNLYIDIPVNNLDIKQQQAFRGRIGE